MSHSNNYLLIASESDDMGRIGLAFTGNQNDIQTYIEGARYAEEQDFESIWFAEDYFFRDSITSATATALNTEHVTIGMFVNPYTRNPSLTAMTAAALDDVADSRVQIAMGAGVPSTINKVLEFEKPLEVIPEHMEVIRSLLAEDVVTHDGEHATVDEVDLGICPYLSYAGRFEPPRKEIPIHVAAIGPQMLKMAGDVGDGLVVSFGAPPKLVEDSIEQVQKGLDMSGRTLNEFLVTTYIVAAPTINDRIRKFATEMIALAEPLLHLDLTEVGFEEEEAQKIQDTCQEDGLDAAAELTTDEMVKTFSIIGDDMDCEARLDEYVDAGTDMPVLFHLGPEHPRETVDIGAEWG